MNEWKVTYKEKEKKVDQYIPFNYLTPCATNLAIYADQWYKLLISYQIHICVEWIVLI